MSDVSWPVYAAILGAAAVLTTYLVPVALRIAVRHDILDRPAGYKQQQQAVPYLGGTAIVLTFALCVLVAAAIRPPTAGYTELAAIMGGAVLVALVGLWDDLRGLGPGVRIAAVLLVATGLWAAGVRVDLAPGNGIDFALTLLWVLGITNAFNLLDNMDGLSAGIAGIAALSFFLIAALNGQFLVAGLAVALAGCAIGFLRHNFHPATIYMGDSGSLFFGFVLAALGIKLRFEAPREVTALVPILVLGVAIFDTTLVVITRLMHRRNPLLGHRDHVSHRFVFVGIPVPASVALIYGAGFSLGWLALITSRLDAATAYLLFGLIVAIGLFAGALLGLVPVYENSPRRHFMLREVAPREPRTDPDAAAHDGRSTATSARGRR
jgi:UDP-GlcNAc:undecaprenyl-phosphate GlcNAc-1-phosphate transferase